MKVVINNCYGGFGLSAEAAEIYKQKTGKKLDPYASEIRSDKILIKIVETMSEKSYGSFAKLKIVEVPDDVKWHIEEYDGNEWVAENHRKWS